MPGLTVFPHDKAVLTCSPHWEPLDTHLLVGAVPQSRMSSGSHTQVTWHRTGCLSTCLVTSHSVLQVHLCRHQQQDSLPWGLLLQSLPSQHSSDMHNITPVRVTSLQHVTLLHFPGCAAVLSLSFGGVCIRPGVLVSVVFAPHGLGPGSGLAVAAGVSWRP